jgi:poly(3-hydroxybutyrate) depolymerase
MSDISPKKKDEKSKRKPKSGNYTADINFSNFLVKDMENLLCVDTSRIYAMGMGVGGGMMHMLACNPELSTSFAAFASVGGIYGRSKDGKGRWGFCKPKRQIPLVEIHGLDDRVAGYYLQEGENGKKRTIPPHWLDDWAERNHCGEPVDDAIQSNTDNATFVTKLENGVMSESVQYGGAAIRIAKKCYPEKNETATEIEEEEKTEEPVSESALTDAETTILHYQLKSYGHGWPRQQLKKQKEVVFKDKQMKVGEDTYFDTTKVILDFFDAHRLEEEFAKRSPVEEAAPIEKGAPGGPPSEEEMAEKMKQFNMEHATLKTKPTQDELEEKLKQFQAAQEKINKMAPASKKPDSEKDQTKKYLREAREKIKKLNSDEGESDRDEL